MKRPHAQQIYRFTSVLLGSLLFIKWIQTYDETEILAECRSVLSTEILSECLPGLSGSNGKETKNGLLFRKMQNSLPVLAYLQGKEGILIESKDIYDWIRWKEGVDEDQRDMPTEEVTQDQEEKSISQNEEVENTDNTVITKEDLEEYKRLLGKIEDFDYLKSHFYTVDRRTTIQSEQLDAKKLMAEDLHIEKDASKDQILIYHTHSQEAYADSVEGDDSTSVVHIGDLLTEYLLADGFGVIHDRTSYDLERDRAYAKAEPALEKMMEEHPDIQVIIDIHRDGVSEETRLVTQWNNESTAQFMFFNGLCRTTENGELTNLQNPYLSDNLAFSLQLQMKANLYYQGMVRKTYLNAYRYNMHFAKRSLLVEVGAQTNTVREAENAVKPLSDILCRVLSGTADD